MSGFFVQSFPSSGALLYMAAGGQTSVSRLSFFFPFFRGAVLSFLPRPLRRFPAHCHRGLPSFVVRRGFAIFPACICACAVKAAAALQAREWTGFPFQYVFCVTHAAPFGGKPAAQLTVGKGYPFGGSAQSRLSVVPAVNPTETAPK